MRHKCQSVWIVSWFYWSIDEIYALSLVDSKNFYAFAPRFFIRYFMVQVNQIYLNERKFIIRWNYFLHFCEPGVYLKMKQYICIYLIYCFIVCSCNCYQLGFFLITLKFKPASKFHQWWITGFFLNGNVFAKKSLWRETCSREYYLWRAGFTKFGLVWSPKYPHSRNAKNSVASANQLNENHLISMKHFHVAPFYLHKLNKL